MYAIAPRPPFGPGGSHPASLPRRPGREGGGAVPYCAGLIPAARTTLPQRSKCDFIIA